MINLIKKRYAADVLLLALIVIVMLLASAEISHGQTFVPLADFSGSPRLQDVYQSKDLPEFMSKLFYAAIAAGAILAVLRLAYAGFTYMASDLPGVKSNAKEIIGETLLGLFLLLGIWVILRQINPQILNLNVNIKPASFTRPSSSASPSGGTPSEPEPSRFVGPPADTPVTPSEGPDRGSSYYKMNPDASQNYPLNLSIPGKPPTYVEDRASCVRQLGQLGEAQCPP